MVAGPAPKPARAGSAISLAFPAQMLAEEPDPSELVLALLRVLREGVDLVRGVGDVDVGRGHQRHVVGGNEYVVTHAAQSHDDAVEDVLFIRAEQIDDVAYMLPLRASHGRLLQHRSPGDWLLRVMRSFRVELGVGHVSPPSGRAWSHALHGACPPEVDRK